MKHMDGADGRRRMAERTAGGEGHLEPRGGSPTRTLPRAMPSPKPWRAWRVDFLWLWRVNFP